ncbi:hypothetical protein PGT21_027339 [Puccinia graminis f. sp. tritici]|uniref:Uncharacterized protein n=1 Tax=Puccinia graminis f. sp. tritici TaxID=56615 RepID=A0A5B0LK92_PUCGR|nr:hypothetical protein PGTUg99_009600 [Puccinia graminis f. sp. tritici]KAA1099988.1 hypothetical protein PGT21_027339 [Puccinia graminis f. sp. tritici]KAA1134461.1 hypothetical protein PGTUg99_001003 [Puccinia graminis f. sp. tritici]
MASSARLSLSLVLHPLSLPAFQTTFSPEKHFKIILTLQSTDSHTNQRFLKDNLEILSITVQKFQIHTR